LFTLCLIAICAAPSAHPATREVDTRLAENVTLAEPQIRVSELLDKLQEATGVEYLYDSAAELQHVAIFCRERPLKEVHQAIESALLWDWVTKDEGRQTVHRLMRGLRYRAAVAEARGRRERAWAQHVSLLVSLARARPQERTSLLERDPLLKNLFEQPRTLPFLEAYAALPAGTLERVLAGNRTTVPFAQLPEVVQRPFRAQLDRIDQTGGFGQEADYGRRGIQRVTLGVRRDRTGRPESLMIEYGFADGRRLQTFSAPFFASAAIRREPVEARRPLVQELARDHPELTEVVRPAETALPRRPGGLDRGIGVALAELHHRTGLSLIAGLYPSGASYRAMSGNTAHLQRDGVELWRILDQIGRAFLFEWTLDKKWYLFRFEDWAWAAPGSEADQ
jgi:hypothetical protein